MGGSTADGDSVAINFNSGGKDGITHRAKDDLKINATVVGDFGPLNLRFSSVIDNQSREFNGLPIYYMFNTDRLGEAERKLSMMNMRANYFLNPNMLVTAGFFSLNRSYEYFDGAFGSGDFAKALGYYDCLLYTSDAADE